MRLSHLDFDALQNGTLQLYEHRDLASLREALPSIFLKMIPADYFGIVDVAVDARLQWMKTVGYSESSPRINEDLIVRMNRFGYDHPFSEYAARTGDPTTLKMSDFFTLNGFRSSKLYEEFYRHADALHVMAFGLVSGCTLTTINVTRRTNEQDFNERDRLMMNLLRPHFEQAHRNAQLVTARNAAAGRPLSAYELTPREMEIACWVAAGKSNPEIAILLNLSPRTVEKHMENILRKLGVENRTTAAVLIANSISTAP
jgi:DNA-binding CsgD family transcriptional regulator